MAKKKDIVTFQRMRLNRRGISNFTYSKEVMDQVEPFALKILSKVKAKMYPILATLRDGKGKKTINSSSAYMQMDRSKHDGRGLYRVYFQFRPEDFAEHKVQAEVKQIMSKE